MRESSETMDERRVEEGEQEDEERDEGGKTKVERRKGEKERRKRTKSQEMEDIEAKKNHTYKKRRKGLTQDWMLRNNL